MILFVGFLELEEEIEQSVVCHFIQGQVLSRALVEVENPFELHDLSAVSVVIGQVGVELIKVIEGGVSEIEPDLVVQCYNPLSTGVHFLVYPNLFDCVGQRVELQWFDWFGCRRVISIQQDAVAF